MRQVLSNMGSDFANNVPTTAATSSSVSTKLSFMPPLGVQLYFLLIAASWRIFCFFLLFFLSILLMSIVVLFVYPIYY